jgi:hypothetical protein
MSIGDRPLTESNAEGSSLASSCHAETLRDSRGAGLSHATGAIAATNERREA